MKWRHSHTYTRSTRDLFIDCSSASSEHQSKMFFSLSSAATVWRFQCRKYNFMWLSANFYDPPMTETKFYRIILDIPPSAVWLQQSSCNGVQNNWNWRWIYANSKNGHKLSTKSSSRIPFVGLDLTEDNIIASNTESNHCSANRSSGSKFPWTLNIEHTGQNIQVSCWSWKTSRADEAVSSSVEDERWVRRDGEWAKKNAFLKREKQRRWDAGTKISYTKM